MCRFHSEDYVGYLESFVSRDIVNKYGSAGIDRSQSKENPSQTLENMELRQQYKVGESTDCPGFNGLYNLCQISSGGSIDSACLLLNGEADIAINWTGGLHHAKKS